MRKGIRQTPILDMTDIDARFWRQVEQERKIYASRKNQNNHWLLRFFKNLVRH